MMRFLVLVLLSSPEAKPFCFVIWIQLFIKINQPAKQSNKQPSKYNQVLCISYDTVSGGSKSNSQSSNGSCTIDAYLLSI